MKVKSHQKKKYLSEAQIAENAEGSFYKQDTLLKS